MARGAWGGGIRAVSDEPEEWRPVEGHPLYEVSNLGRVRSWVPRGPPGRGERASVPRVLRPYTAAMRMLRVALHDDGVPRQRCVHLLVAEAFLGARHARHRNGDTRDNRVANLEPLASRAETLGRLTAEEVRTVLADPSVPGGVWARRLGVSPATISNVRSGVSWAGTAPDLPRKRRR